MADEKTEEHFRFSILDFRLQSKIANQKSKIICILCLALCGCEADEPEADIPEVPLLHPQASTIPQQNAIRIEWEVSTNRAASPTENLAGYKVYRSTSPEERDFQVIATVSERDSYYEDTDVSIRSSALYRTSYLITDNLLTFCTFLPSRSATIL